jgi:hypothetical protein
VKGKGVFLYEYATCGSVNEISPSMAVEGLGMFKALEWGFSSCGRVNTFVDPAVKMFQGYPRDKFSDDLFFEFIQRADECLIIAPESDGILYRLTRTLEKADCANLGSSSKGVRETADKYSAYKKLKSLSPKTEIYRGSTTLSLPLVAKPRDGVSGEGIIFLREEEDLAKVPEGYIIQEYVEGRPMSAAFIIGDETTLLSVNTQELRGFEYVGSKLPVEGLETDTLFKALERIKGLHGYVGVDFVYDQDITVIEVNPRLTTPVVAYKEAYGVNVAELLLRNYYCKPLPPIRRRRRVHLLKTCENVVNSYISFKGRSLLLREWSQLPSTNGGGL